MASTISAGTTSTTSLSFSGDTSGVLQLQTNGTTTAVTIDTAQNVGVGVTPSAWSTSGYPALQLKSGGAFWSTSANGTVYSQNTYFNGTNQIYLTTNPATYYQQYNGTHIWQYAASGTAGNTVSFTQGMTLDANGNLGLGVTPSTYWTTTLGPVFQFGTGYSFLASQGSTSAIYFGTNAYYNSGWKYGQSGQASLYEQYQGAHSWYNAPSGSAGGTVTFTQAMTLDNSGNLLVGVTATGAGEKFAVSGANGTNQVGVFSNTSTGNQGGLTVSFNTGAGTTSSYFFKGTASGVGAWYLFGNGTSSFTSDERRKKNIEPARNGYIDDLMKLEVVKYQWKANSDDSVKELGLIAQQVETVFPSLVQDALEPAEDGIIYKTFKASVLPFILLKAIQELSAQVTALQAKVGV